MRVWGGGARPKNCDIMTSMKRFLIVFAMVAVSFLSLPVMAASETEITKTQEHAIVDHCDSIRDNLKNVQKLDSRTRVYLGGYYETILSKFITPLNVRLVENNLSTAGFVENQNKIAEAKALFSNDFVSYQQGLEELVAMDCKTGPTDFYKQLEKVRQKRKTVEQDVLKLRTLISRHIELVENLKGDL